MKNKLVRWSVIVGALIAGCIIFTAVFFGLANNNELYVTPTNLINNPPAAEQRLMLGGVVEIKSVEYLEPLLVQFRINEANQASIIVQYQGILPNMFAEGQGVAVRGVWNNQMLVADQVLAMHGEEYQP